MSFLYASLSPPLRKLSLTTCCFSGFPLAWLGWWSRGRGVVQISQFRSNAELRNVQVGQAIFPSSSLSSAVDALGVKPDELGVPAREGIVDALGDATA